jgi:hypothetical protein
LDDRLPLESVITIDRNTQMWQQITGRIEVLDDAVRVEIDLPWVMQLLRDTIAKRVRGRGIALLEWPPDEVLGTVYSIAISVRLGAASAIHVVSDAG